MEHNELEAGLTERPTDRQTGPPTQQASLHPLMRSRHTLMFNETAFVCVIITFRRSCMTLERTAKARWECVSLNVRKRDENNDKMKLCAHGCVKFLSKITHMLRSVTPSLAFQALARRLRCMCEKHREVLGRIRALICLH